MSQPFLKASLISNFDSLSLIAKSKAISDQKLTIRVIIKKQIAKIPKKIVKNIFIKEIINGKFDSIRVVFNIESPSRIKPRIKEKIIGIIVIPRSVQNLSLKICQLF